MEVTIVGTLIACGVASLALGGLSIHNALKSNNDDEITTVPLSANLNKYHIFSDPANLSKNIIITDEWDIPVYNLRRDSKHAKHWALTSFDERLQVASLSTASQGVRFSIRSETCDLKKVICYKRQYGRFFEFCLHKSELSRPNDSDSLPSYDECRPINPILVPQLEFSPDLTFNHWQPRNPFNDAVSQSSYSTQYPSSILGSGSILPSTGSKSKPVYHWVTSSKFLEEVYDCGTSKERREQIAFLLVKNPKLMQFDISINESKIHPDIAIMTAIVCMMAAWKYERRVFKESESSLTSRSRRGYTSMPFSFKVRTPFLSEPVS